MSDSQSFSDERKGKGMLGKIGRHVSGLFHKGPKNIGISEVRSKETVIYEGFIRKKNTSTVVGKALETFNIKWSLFYVLVTNKNIYYFKNETAQAFSGKFSLYGYNKVKRVPEHMKNTTSWPEFSFMIVHASDEPHTYKTYYFSATKNADLKTWIYNIRKALLAANESLVSGAMRRMAEAPLTELTEMEEEIYSSEQFKHGGVDGGEAIESDDEDYLVIDEMDIPTHIPNKSKPLPRLPDGPIEAPPPRPRKATFNSQSSSDVPYTDFDHDSNLSKHAPTSPGSTGTLDGTYRHVPTPSPSSNNNLPKFLEPTLFIKAPDSPANDVLNELLHIQGKIAKSQKNKPTSPAYSRSAESGPQSTDSIPENPAPSKPIKSAKPTPDYPHVKPRPPPTSSKPGGYKASNESDIPPSSTPPKTPLKPKKPTMQVRPNIKPERKYWNGSKDECNAAIKESAIGVFLVRLGSDGVGKVLVISGGDNTCHQVKLIQYRDGTMGLKNEGAVADEEKFPDVESLVRYYKSNSIYLRSGTLQLKLQRPHHLCDDDLETFSVSVVIYPKRQWKAVFIDKNHCFSLSGVIPHHCCECF